MRHIHTVLLLAAAFAGSAIIHAGPLPACGSQFEYGCTSATLGGYTVITPLSLTGQTEITGYDSSNGVVFDQTIPVPPTGPAGSDVRESVLQADALLAVQSGQASTLPACTPSTSAETICLGSWPGGSVNVSHSQTYSYVAQDTPVTQRVDQYSTTLIARLNGNQVFSQTFALPFSDPAWLAAISSADGILTGDGAGFGTPFLASGSTSLLGSQLSYVQTGRIVTGNFTVTTTDTFGPAAVIGCIAVLQNCNNSEDIFKTPDLTLIPSGPLDINVNTDLEYAILRNLVTTNTFLTTQTYEIDGIASAIPEPATWGLALAGACLIAIRKIWRPRSLSFSAFIHIHRLDSV